jgi:glycerol transport system substrate-binding protein
MLQKKFARAVLFGAMTPWLVFSGMPVFADTEAAQRWLQEFQPSTLRQEQQMAELQWFIDAAAPYRGMEIKVVSETLTKAMQDAGFDVRHCVRDQFNLTAVGIV